MSNVHNPENKALKDFKVLNFDVYGTLIDWESGVVDALEPLLKRSSDASKWTRREKLEMFEEVEAELQRANPDMIYSTLLTHAHSRLASKLGIESTRTLDEAFGQSVRAWEPFPDTCAALATLSKHYKLVVLSNVDNETFKYTRDKLESGGGKFSLVVTAQDVGSYKPDERNFLYVLREIEREFGVTKDQVLVTAQREKVSDEMPNTMCSHTADVSIGRNSGASYTFVFPTLGAMGEGSRGRTPDTTLAMSQQNRRSGRNPIGRAAVAPPAPPQIASAPPAPPPENPELFVDLMMGAPLSIYVEKDVPGRDDIVRLIEKHGGIVATAYSTVPYILVDPSKESGQNLFRQYSAKRGKIVLNAQWVHACVQAGQLQTFKTNYAGFKVDGTERDRAPDPPPAPDTPRSATRRSATRRRTDPQPPPFPLQYQQWDHQHYPPQPQPPYYPGPPPAQWHTNQQYSPLAVPVIEGSAYGPPYPGYPGDEQAWAAGEDPDQYYEQFHQVEYGYVIPTANPPVAETQPEHTSQSPEAPEPEEEEEPRGRKRTRSGRARNALSEKVDPQKLVSARGPPTRSPDPPARVIKSTHGGNLFTADDVQYLKSYIEYCQNQGLVLSLREICERLAVKAPHHTFYSWRRYCNKHQIRLGAYAMDDPISEDRPGPSSSNNTTSTHQLAAPSSSAAGRPSAIGLGRTDRSPTPPRALYRSTTGKGIAFTETDVTFLMRFLHYRRRKNPELDMVQFWKDVAERAPHHSRASWMKYWRRHKHELETEAPNPPPTTSFTHPQPPHAQPQSQPQEQQPLPQGPPQKRKRYDHDDDMLLAQYFATGPQGTSDAIFQRFARMHPHHPWKGWQEHHRIHKTQIDHLMKKILQSNAAAALAAGAAPPGGPAPSGSGAGSTSGAASASGSGSTSAGPSGVPVVDDGLQNFGLDAMET
ncbi:hypothetical protein CTheo_1833 [Ceratobasidium theobromae]|uniref:BRCT domain-containing protein n=1 Tax=Ceratobasidium theobromae TaxID=1582974 RepID=A0A5N5QU45_9AGAM|nr:hypothetical protein CTheo_1833 [Ceratobasidium theobromae]